MQLIHQNHSGGLQITLETLLNDIFYLIIECLLVLPASPVPDILNISDIFLVIDDRINKQLGSNSAIFQCYIFVLTIAKAQYPVSHPSIFYFIIEIRIYNIVDSLFKA